MENSERLLRKAFLTRDEHNGYYASVVVNTGRVGLPIYLQEFIASLVASTNGLLYLEDVFVLSDNWKYWKQLTGNAREGDCIYQYIFSLKLPLTEREFSRYITPILMNDFLPFIMGCQFSMLGLMLSYKMPEKYTGIGVSGDYSVTIEEKHLGADVCVALEQAFNMDKASIEAIREYANEYGSFTLSNKISKDKLTLAKELLSNLGVKHEIKIG